MSSELTPQVAGQLELDSLQFRALLYEVGEQMGVHLESLDEQPSSDIARKIKFSQFIFTVRSRRDETAGIDYWLSRSITIDYRVGQITPQPTRF